jgi:hypothetical protein
MAISGAAASSNMGARSNRALTPTLALLNVRVGFWLRNPGFVRNRGWAARLCDFFSLWFLSELIARLRETSWKVYLTDGGHLENLGAYALLKRRCRLIVIVDAEADPEMKFSSLMTLQRYARIDLGIRITIPWQQIRETTLKVTQEAHDGSMFNQRPGPHCAVGTVDYATGASGIIVYIKASLTGDENDYVRDYKSRYALFPHESTADQFFTEEQFETYRALGFHAVSGFFDRRHAFAFLDPEVYTGANADLHLLDRLFPRRMTADDGRWPQTCETFVARARACATFSSNRQP